MKFVIDTPERLRQELQNFPEYFQKGFFTTRKLLMLCISNDGEAIAACGVANLSNYLLIYVDKDWRGKGIGTRILGKTIKISRNRGFNFIALAVRPNNLPALRLYSKFNFKEVVNLKQFGFILMILPFNMRGRVVYAFSRAICSVLPKSILVNIVICMRSAVKSTRTWFRWG
jgi:RimJ/RimL family protein N-acetyltransferase